MWTDTDWVRERWVNPLSEDVLEHLLEVAHEQCVAFLGSHWDDEDETLTVPARFREAELQQARNIFNASKADPGESADGTQFIIRPYPLDNHVKQLLLPARSIPGMW